MSRPPTVHEEAAAAAAAASASAASSPSSPGRGDSAVLHDVEALFRSVDADGAGFIRKGRFLSALADTGLRADDARLRETMRRLHEFGRKDPIDEVAFAAIVAPSLDLVARALQGHLVIPHWSKFTDALTEIYEQTLSERGGKNADYIPYLARKDPEKYGVAVCTVDGQMFSIGDSEEDVCAQSCCKPITYLLSLMEHGDEHTHKFVGREPSGVRFNALALNERGQPHNPLINSGAIMCTSLVRPGLPMSERFGHVLSAWRRLAGGQRVGYSNTVYLSERSTADRNFALAYMMKGAGAFPPGADLTKTLELYFQCCSIEVTASSGAVVAGSLANAGTCPITEEKVVPDPTHVRHVLSLMYSCGMYDFSGEFAFTIGLPAKSGVSGLIMLVVPDVCGVCVWSPRLDEIGNSARGIAFCKEFVRRFSFHRYDSVVVGSGGADGGRNDPSKGGTQAALAHVVQFLYAAAEGDIVALKQVIARRIDVNTSDYDKRTALHLAASESQAEAVRFLLRHGARPDAADRWGHTPLDDARRAGADEVVRILAEALAESSSSPSKK